MGQDKCSFLMRIIIKKAPEIIWCPVEEPLESKIKGHQSRR